MSAWARHITGQKISCSTRRGLSLAPIKRVNISSSIWYDAKGGGLRDMDVTMRYQRQCWGLKFEMVKKPGDFTTLFMVELAGLNSEPSKDDDKVSQKDEFGILSFAGWSSQRIFLPINSTASRTVTCPVSTIISGFSGSSYGTFTPGTGQPFSPFL